MSPQLRAIVLSGALALFACVGTGRAERPQGSIVGWGSQPIPVDLSHGFVAVAAGDLHNLGLKADGSIVAWGNNLFGQTIVPAPNSGFIAVAGGQYHSLGLKSDGFIVAWGRDHYGETNVPAPNSGFVAVAAGGWYSIGLKSDGSIVAWGNNSDGRTNVPAPNTGFVAVAAGEAHNLGLKSDGSIVAWGRDHYGETNVPAPNSGFVAVAAGGWHSLGLKADGSIVAWGNNSDGQTNVPAPNSGFVSVAAGFAHSMGLKSDGSIVAWGDNRLFGQTKVPDPNTGFVAIAAGAAHSLAIRGASKATAEDKAPRRVPAPTSKGQASGEVRWATFYIEQLDKHMRRLEQELSDRERIGTLIRSVRNAFQTLAKERSKDNSVSKTLEMIDVMKSLNEKGGVTDHLAQDPFDYGRLKTVAFYEQWSRGLLGFGIADHCHDRISGLVTQSYESQLPADICRLVGGALDGLLSDSAGQLIVPGLRYYKEPGTPLKPCLETPRARWTPVPEHEFKRTACEAGQQSACVGLGFHYENGIGVPQDKAVARRLYQQGCSGGDAWGCTCLAILTDDSQERARLFEKACLDGEYMACARVAHAHETGEGVSKDVVSSMWIYALICEVKPLGTDACENRDRLCRSFDIIAPPCFGPGK